MLQFNIRQRVIDCIERGDLFEALLILEERTKSVEFAVRNGNQAEREIALLRYSIAAVGRLERSGAEAAENSRRERIRIASSILELSGDIERQMTHEEEGMSTTTTARNIFGPKEKKVLLLSASPIDEVRLRLDVECRDLQEKLALVRDPKQQILVKPAFAVRVDQIQDAILNERPDILHFSGHGGKDGLFFEDSQGRSIYVSSEAFSELVELNSAFIRCVVLNSCYSHDLATSIRPHVDCVIGCSGEVFDKSSIAFSRAFYRALANGRSYGDSYRLAVNDIRISGTSEEAEKFKCLLGGNSAAGG